MILPRTLLVTQPLRTLVIHNNPEDVRPVIKLRHPPPRDSTIYQLPEIIGWLARGENELLAWLTGMSQNEIDKRTKSMADDIKKGRRSSNGMDSEVT